MVGYLINAIDCDKLDNSNATFKKVVQIAQNKQLCGDDCEKGFFSTARIYYTCGSNKDQWIEYLEKNLPALEYVTRRFIDYLFSNGLTTGDENDDVDLNEWLSQPNIHGDSNISVLKEAIYISMIWGKVGLRAIDRENGIVYYRKNDYMPAMMYNKELYAKELVGYAIRPKDHENSICSDDLAGLTFNYDDYKRSGNFYDENKDVLILSPDEFTELKWFPGNKKGESPLLKDQLRLTLIMEVYERLNYDLEYDGPGRQIWKPTDFYGDMDNETSTSDALASSDKAKSNKMKSRLEGMENFAKEWKNSSSDQIGVVPPGMELVDKFPRTTKATEFFDYIEEVGDVICQIYATPSALYEMGRVYGNVSMAAVIDNAILNSVVPNREKYSDQFTNLLANLLGYESITFDKYELQQVNTDNEERLQVVEMITELREAGYDELADVLAQILQNDIMVAGELATLAIKHKADKAKITSLSIDIQKAFIELTLKEEKPKWYKRNLKDNSKFLRGRKK